MKNIGSSDLVVSKLCLGGNPFGWGATKEESFEVLDKYVAAGGNFIDTADLYSQWKPGNVGGESETIIGSWMKSRKNRDHMVIATKVAMLDTRKGLSESNIAAALDDSLARLGTDYIDLYYAHQDDQETPLVETLGAFDAAVNVGKVRALGASNYSQERLQEALNISKESGFAPYVALQTWFNLLDQDKLPTSYRSFCVANNIGVLPFYGVARGFLTGKYRPGITVESVRASGVESYANDRGWSTLDKLEEIGKAHGAPIASIALAWLRAQESIVAPIASARIASQLDDLLPTPQLTHQELLSLTKVGA